MKGKVTGQITWIVQEPDGFYVIWGNKTYTEPPPKPTNYYSVFYKGDDNTLGPGFETSTAHDQDVTIGSLIQIPANPISEVDSLSTVNFYDKYGRIIQTQSDNIRGGTDITFTKYDFAGKVIASKIIHNYTGDNDQVTVRKYYYYDHAQRLTSVYQKINNNDYVLLYANEYNELGQLITKNLNGGYYSAPGTASDPINYLQEVDYEYNIRGWLTNMNYPDTMGDDLFAMKLYYADEFTALGADEQYNGNITAMEWRSMYSAGLSDNQAYGYQYDEINQLKKAKYGAGSNYTSEAECYDLAGIDYDENGNYVGQTFLFYSL